MKPGRVLMFVAGTVLSANALAQQEQEPNNTQAAANVVAATSVTQGVLNPANDQDWFTFTLTQPSSLRIECTATGDDTCVTMDPTIELRNSNGQLVFDDDGGVALCSLIHPGNYPVVGNLPAGQYWIRISQLSSNPAADYLLSVSSQVVLTEEFTYQGVLRINGQPVTGARDLTLSLWTDPTATNPAARIGTPIHYPNRNIVDGLVNLPVRFTDGAFMGQVTFLQVEVAEAGAGPGGVVLERVKVGATPNSIYALRAKQAETAGTATYATTAGSANSANTATVAAQASFASSAGSAQTATSASTATVAQSANSVPWSGVTSKPAGFADGVDNEGPWLSFSNGTAIYSPSGTQVAINTTNFGGFTLAVNGTAGKPGGGSWSVFCDSRLKHDIVPLSGTLDRLLTLRGYSFKYHDEAVESHRALPGTQLGLLAEEVEAVFPDWVERDADGYRFVTERATTALMVEGLRDLRAEKDAAIARKQEEIDALTRRLAELEARLNRIERSASR